MSSRDAVDGTAEAASVDGGRPPDSIAPSWNAEKPRRWDPWMDGEFDAPHIEMPNEVNFLGGLGPNVGHPRSKVHIQRPTTVQQIYNMRTQNRTLFTFTEAPDKVNNVVVKAERIDHTNVRRIRGAIDRVRLGQNVETPPPSDFSEDPTELFDAENPLNLDLQGLDRRETFQRDEQIHQNQREYRRQLSNIQNRHLFDRVQWNDRRLQERYSTPEYFRAQQALAADATLLVERDSVAAAIPWTDKYRLAPDNVSPRLQRPIPEVIQFVAHSDDDEPLARLVRNADKPKNVARAQRRLDRRLQANVDLERRKLEKLERQRQRDDEQRRLDEEDRIMRLGEADFGKHFIDDLDEKRLAYANLPPLYTEQKYPHTLRETRFVRRQMNRDRRERRDVCAVRMRCAAEQNRTTVCTAPAADQQSDEDAVQLSEQSTDDDDALSVGRTPSGRHCRLRGFQYKMGATMRGIRTRLPQSKLDRPVRTCLTRAQWFEQMTAMRPTVRRGHDSSMGNTLRPSDPNYNIFEAGGGEPVSVRSASADVAPVREMLLKGVETKAPKRLTLKLKRPKYVKVRKFNMTAYMFGVQKEEVAQPIVTATVQAATTAAEKAAQRHKAMRHNRMRTLGIPIVSWSRKTDEQIAAEAAASNDSDSDRDWVPERKPAATKQAVPGQPTISRQIAEICAPHFRESIMNATKPNFTSDQTDDRHPYDVPRMCALSAEHVIPPKLDIRRTEYTDLFAARWHHPHRDATQHKAVIVRYLPKLPEFQLPPVKRTRADREKPFQRALFRGGQPLREDLSMPRVVLAATAEKGADATASVRRAIDVQQHDSRQEAVAGKNIFKSRQDIPSSIDKDDFLKLIKSRHSEAVAGMQADAAELIAEKQSVRNELELIQQMRAELDSIKSCNTSRTSSNSSSSSSNSTNNTTAAGRCGGGGATTNQSNSSASTASASAGADSGSYFELQGHRVPCAYVNRSVVPFEEVDRCRVVTGPLRGHSDYNDAYYHVPFAGQTHDMRQLCRPKDRFFTSGCRARNGVRQRLLVPTAAIAADRIGIGAELRLVSRLATEWDSYYQNEILTRPRCRRFKPRTAMALARDSLRKAFQSHYVRESLVEHRIVARRVHEYAAHVERFRDVCVPLFTRWQENHYRAYMRKMQELKPLYVRTDELQAEVRTLRNAYTKLNMRIIYLEDDWRRRTIMQNFHYLLADGVWRQANDWIHREATPSADAGVAESAGHQLENFRTSIRRRAQTNVRQRDKDSAWAVKSFYEEFFERQPEARTVHIVFGGVAQFESGVQSLTAKSFVCLLELHFAMWVLANVEHGYRSFKRYADEYIARRQKFVRARCAQKYFHSELAVELRQAALEMADGPVRAAVVAPQLRQLCVLCETMYVQMVPAAERANMANDADIVDKFAMIVKAAMRLLADLQTVPHELRLHCEYRVRNKNALLTRQAIRACDLNNRIQLNILQLRKSLAPPSKPKPLGHPLPRSRLPVRRKALVPPAPQPDDAFGPSSRRVRRPQTVLTDMDKLFYKAFTDQPPPPSGAQYRAEDAAMLRRLSDNCIPFYFDYFLQQHNYFPVYDFVTDIERLDGSEFDHFRYEDAVDQVHERLEHWQRDKQQRILEHVQQTWHLYRADDP